MLKWLKKRLGVDKLLTELNALREEQDGFYTAAKEANEIRAGLEAAVKQADEERAVLEAAVKQADEELSTFRKKEEKDKEKYESTEPWVEIRSAEFNENRGIRIELDWNDAFVNHLKESGIKGSNEEEIVQKWLAFLYHDLIEKLESKSIDRKDSEGTVSDYV
ncbi:hypothetical protein E4H12_00835 [Candidatus Thorarchaeota archaeon]|nr:MAG: hypothetical protein E4H12_00835 [Candidatus Thorarchaeota archaeon]